ncbi:hypothetical protein [Vibrio sp. MEBiC08052]|uniref:hypothetical protein n=1 Tax=Vibrio sp. MEBiC08052 TaxID=1761910 RepID=UPI00074084E9|nr:hypothetical protein [Vibrio sp. MEBiC08052]KUI97034.1 hypothetical protein VRK_38890 [Vibrio sp. MEBiC08052]
MSKLISKANISDQTAICILVDGQVSLKPLPQLPCTIHLCNIHERHCYDKHTIRLAALNEALSPICTAAIFMGLNVLPEKSLNPFLKLLKSDVIEQIALYPSRIRPEDIQPEMREEFFRRQAIAKNYYTSDLLALNVNQTGGRLAFSRTFDLLKRMQQLKMSDQNTVDDILNKLLPGRLNFRPNEVFTLYPLMIQPDDHTARSEMRCQADSAKGAIVFDAQNLPWSCVNQSAAEQIYPFDLYADAMLSAAEWVTPDFVKTVLTKAFMNPECLSRYPASLVQAVQQDMPADHLYQIIGQLNQEGAFQ